VLLELVGYVVGVCVGCRCCGVVGCGTGVFGLHLHLVLTYLVYVADGAAYTLRLYMLWLVQTLFDLLYTLVWLVLELSVSVVFCCNLLVTYWLLGG